MNALKSRIADLITDQVEMKVGLRGVRGLIRDVRREAQNHVNVSYLFFPDNNFSLKQFNFIL